MPALDWAKENPGIPSLAILEYPCLRFGFVKAANRYCGKGTNVTLRDHATPMLYHLKEH